MFNGRIKKITSSENIKVKEWTRLNDRSYREECGRCLVTSEKIIRDISKRVSILSLMFTEEKSEEALKIKALSYFSLPEALIKKITKIPSPPQFIAEVSIAPPSSLENLSSLLILDRVTDPGNLGTLCRTALGLNWQGVFLIEGSCDLFNEKCIRASSGSCFSLPYRYGTSLELYDLLKKNRLTLYVADMKGEPLTPQLAKGSVALLLGNEGSGVDDEMKQKGHLISIPLSEKVESLNVTSAASIFMYMLKGEA